MNTTIRRLPSQVPTSLESWTGHDWRHGVLLPQLGPFDQLIVSTRNSTYEIVVIEPETATVMVRGGSFFPEFSKARVAGSSLGGGLLKLHGVYAGFQMELVAGERILTTCVRSVSVLKAGIGTVM